MASKKDEDIAEPLDLESKDIWLRKFRMAKTQQTLTLMVERAIDQYHQISLDSRSSGSVISSSFLEAIIYLT